MVASISGQWFYGSRIIRTRRRNCCFPELLGSIIVALGMGNREGERLCCRPAIVLALSFTSHPPSIYKICFRFIIVLPEFRGERYSL
ncbi:Hypothetical predicted protein [Prunus dulcis]|uniref:Uncharacterized protein n=1 Tax=Prunus dulcis TaxID=3755 RepID=A0A5E4GB95_PRUDU|nr:Hypothetical predicted protein [Prunus dulcis]